MNFTNAKYVSYLGNNKHSIRAELDGKNSMYTYKDCQQTLPSNP